MHQSECPHSTRTWVARAAGKPSCWPWKSKRDLGWALLRFADRHVLLAERLPECMSMPLPAPVDGPDMGRCRCSIRLCIRAVVGHTANGGTLTEIAAISTAHSPGTCIPISLATQRPPANEHRTRIAVSSMLGP